MVISLWHYLLSLRSRVHCVEGTAGLGTLSGIIHDRALQDLLVWLNKQVIHHQELNLLKRAGGKPQPLASQSGSQGGDTQNISEVVLNEIIANSR